MGIELGGLDGIEFGKQNQSQAQHLERLTKVVG